MRYKLPNGQTIGLNQGFSFNGTSYPSNWIESATEEERNFLGLIEIPEYPRPDDRFYIVTQNDDGTFTSVPKDMNYLKSIWLQWVNDSAWNILHMTDYMDSRKANDPEYNPPADWLAWRASIRAQAKTVKQAIAASTDIPSLQQAIAVQWVADPTVV